MTYPLANLPFRAFSPSLFEYRAPSGTVQIAYNGAWWVVGVDGIYGARPFESRQEAALMVWEAFRDAFNQRS